MGMKIKMEGREGIMRLPHKFVPLEIFFCDTCIGSESIDEITFTNTFNSMQPSFFNQMLDQKSANVHQLLLTLLRPCQALFPCLLQSRSFLAFFFLCFKLFHHHFHENSRIVALLILLHSLFGAEWIRGILGVWN